MAVTWKTLSAPIQLTAGQTLADKRYQLASDFAWDSRLAAIYIAAPDVTIRNVHLFSGYTSWQSRWNTHPESGPPGINTGMVGIRAQGSYRLRIEDCSIRGFPRVGITGYGLDDGVLRGIRIQNCFQGISTEHYQRNRRMLIEDVRVSDTWGPIEGLHNWVGVVGYPSLKRPGGYIGSDGMVLASLRDSFVHDCQMSGETFGAYKIVNAQRSRFQFLTGVNFQFQGTSDLTWTIDPEPSNDCLVQRCTIDKSLGYGSIQQEAHGIQLAWNINSLAFRDCRVYARGEVGHGAQADLAVNVTFRDCEFAGWNRKAGPSSNDDAYALDLRTGSSVNADFATANRFIQQTRILRTINN